MPPKRRIAINEVGHAHELTFSTYRRLPVFEDRKSGELFLAALDEARQRLAFDQPYWSDHSLADTEGHRTSPCLAKVTRQPRKACPSILHCSDSPDRRLGMTPTRQETPREWAVRWSSLRIPIYDVGKRCRTFLAKRQALRFAFEAVHTALAHRATHTYPVLLAPSEQT